jgi:branched-chain amino acid transport system substrate-binding protein
VFLVAEAIKNAKSTKPADMIKALEATKWSGTRGEVTFSSEKSGFKYHQWLDVPYVTFQVTKVKQPVADMDLVQDPGKPLDASRVNRPQ